MAKEEWKKSAEMPPVLDVSPDGIPADLKDLNQWICWSLKNKSGEWAKIPTKAGSLYAADATKPGNWSDFDHAAYQVEIAHSSGLAFVFTEQDPFCGIDLDDCLHEDGSLEPWARAIVNQIGSYTEISPSCTGLKIFCRAKLPENARKKYGHVNVEIYDQKRFFCVTGQVWQGLAEIVDAQDAVDDLLATLYAGDVPGHRKMKLEPEASGSTNAERARKYVDRIPGAISGQDGHGQTFWVAQVLTRDFGLSLDEAWPIMLDYNQRCQPEWTEKELRHKLEDASENSRRPKGTKAKESARQRRAAFQKEKKESGPLVVTTFSDIDLRPLRWLVKPYVPMGKLTIIAGPGGHGKSTVTLSLGAALSRADLSFAGIPIETRKTDSLFIACEDDVSDTLAPRALALGADMTRLHHVDGTRDEDGRLQPFGMDDMDALKDYLASHPETAMVVIDPATAFVGRAQVDDHRDSELRALLSPLADLAAEHDVAIILVMHVNKAAATKAVNRVIGSVAYVNAARSALLLGPDPEDDNRKLIVPLKSNLAKDMPCRAFGFQALLWNDSRELLQRYVALSEEDRSLLADQLYRIVWEDDPVDMDADRVLGSSSNGDKSQNRVKECWDWMQRQLEEGPIDSKELFSRADGAGFSRGLCYRVKEDHEEVRATKSGGSTSPWVWSIGPLIRGTHPFLGKDDDV